MLTQAVQTIVETIVSVSNEESLLLVSFFTHLTPRQAEWTRIRQALPPQVSRPPPPLCTDYYKVNVKNSVWVDCFLLCPQWVKMPLLSSRYRGVCEQPVMDVWKSPLSARLPAHLCACALLGKVARLSAFRPSEQKTTHLQILMTTGSNCAHLYIRL